MSQMIPITPLTRDERLPTLPEEGELSLSSQVLELQSQMKKLSRKFKRLESKQVEMELSQYIKDLWHPIDQIRTDASIQLSKIGAPAIPLLIRAIKYNSHSKNEAALITPPPLWTFKFVPNNQEALMIKAAVDALHRMIGNAKAISKLKVAVFDLIEDMEKRGLKLHKTTSLIDATSLVYLLARQLKIVKELPRECHATLLLYKELMNISDITEEIASRPLVLSWEEYSDELELKETEEAI